MRRGSILLPLVILSILTFLDRIAISVAAPRIQQELQITPDRWGWVIGAFVLAYGIFELPTGALGDVLGQRKVLTRIVLWWSAFTALTGAAASFVGLVAIRFLFGIGEAGAYPNIAGVISRHFPLKERARTQGYIWAASRLGGALSPLIVVPLQRWLGWRVAFSVLGLMGVLWTIWWWFGLHASPEGAVPIRKSHATIPWRTLFQSPQLWLIFTMYFCYAWGSWFFFGWFPTYLTKSAGFSEGEMAFLSALPFLAGAAGNVAGGFLSDRMVARFGAKHGRRLIGCVSLGGSAVLLVGLSQAKGKIAIAILSTLGFGVADLMLPTAWAICLDIGGAFAGSVSGFMNTAGQLGGFLCSIAYGYVVQATGSYNLPLAMVASMVLISAFLFAKIDASKPIA
jgi:MFS family permease